MLNPANHPEGCLCDWCCAIKRQRRQRVQTQVLQSVLTEPITHKDKTYLVRAGVDRTRDGRKGWNLQARKCDRCSRLISLSKGNLSLRPHNESRNGGSQCVGGRPIPKTIEDVDTAHAAALKMNDEIDHVKPMLINDLLDFRSWLKAQ